MNSLAEDLERFRRGAELLATVLTGAGGEEIDYVPGPGKWSIRQIMAHLADSELVGAQRLRAVIAEENPTLMAFDQDAWAKGLDYSQLPLELSRSIYASTRSAIIHYARLHYNQHGHLEFVHSETGVRTLQDEFDKVASHNQHHLEQISSALRQM